jgi:hypothetical protein
MRFSLLQGQLWIWGLTPTILHPLGGPGSHTWKTSLLLQKRNEFGSWVGMDQ